MSATEPVYEVQTREDGNLYLVNVATGDFRADNAWVKYNDQYYFPNSAGILYRNQRITFGPDLAHYMGDQGYAVSGVHGNNGVLYYYENDSANKHPERKNVGWIDHAGKQYFARAGGQLYVDQFITFGPDVIYFLNKNGQKVVENFLFAGHNFSVDKNGVVSKEDYQHYLEYDLEPMKSARATLSSLGWNLRRGFEYAKNLTYYGNAMRLPSIKDYATFGFTHLKGNCYVKASVFYYFAKLMDLEVSQVDGYIGGTNRHSWIEIKHGGEIFVYDPINLAGVSSDRLYRIKYGQPGTLKYTFLSYMR